jgi:hypothetical protein
LKRGVRTKAGKIRENERSMGSAYFLSVMIGDLELFSDIGMREVRRRRVVREMQNGNRPNPDLKTRANLSVPPSSCQVQIRYNDEDLYDCSLFS